MRGLPFAKISGQSLVEVMVAVLVIALTLTSLVALAVLSLANTKYIQNKAKATKYAQEAMEWLRIQKNTLSWSTFSSYASDPGDLYCLDSISINLTNLTPALSGTHYIRDPSNPMHDTCLNNPIPNSIFIREAHMSQTSDPDRVNLIVAVIWPQGNTNKSVILDTIMTQWQ